MGYRTDNYNMGRGSPSSSPQASPRALGRETRRIFAKISKRERKSRSSRHIGRSSRVTKHTYPPKSTSGLRVTKKKDDGIPDKLLKGPNRQILGGIGSNISALCYINAALQALAATSYVDWIAKNMPADGAAEKPLTDTIHKTFQFLNTYYLYKDWPKGTTMVTPSPTDLDLADFEGRQQSAVELIERLHLRLLRESEGTENPLEGRMVQRVACLGCGHISWSEAEWTTLRLEKPHVKARGQTISLAGCLEFHRRVGPREGEGITCWRCVTIATRNILSRALKRRHADSLSVERIIELRRRLGVADNALKNRTYGNDDIQKDLKLVHRKPPYPHGLPKVLTAAERKEVMDAYYQELKEVSIRYFPCWSEAQAISKLPRILVLEFPNVAGFIAPGKVFDPFKAPPKNKNTVKYLPTQNFWRFLLGDEREASPVLRIRPKDGDDDDGGNKDVETTKDEGRKGEESSDPAKTLMYDLRAVLIHRGEDMGKGHWVTYRREWQDPASTKEEEWWLCNEHSTMRVTRADIFGAVEDKGGKGTAYGLVYELLPPGTAPAKKPGKMPKTNWRMDEGLADMSDVE
ncbi:hypothetical protein TWF696_006437 [Orbilia brochopaga]|uniref:ubiquitinyl hydrolase 1 n=1 Tax=Orbilia brochopaga TaxID=3140254 RepID=A0AAV9UWX7_9PEZI